MALYLKNLRQLAYHLRIAHLAHPRALVLPVLLMVAAAVSSRQLGSPARPTHFASASGRFRLYELDAQSASLGDTEYAMEALPNRELQWKVSLKRPLDGAAISEAGGIVAYSYSTGLMGDPSLGDERNGLLLITVLDNQGKVRQELSIRRFPPGASHVPPVPVLAGIVINESAGIAIVEFNQLSSAGGESWWILDVATGELVSAIQPAKVMNCPLGTGRVATISEIAGTPLILVGWKEFLLHAGAEHRKCSRIFAVFDRFGRMLWREDLEEKHPSTSGSDLCGQLVPDMPQREFRIAIRNGPSRTFECASLGIEPEWVVVEK